MECPKPKDFTYEELRGMINTCKEVECEMRMYKNWYEKGYKDGYNAAMKAVWELVEKHLDRSV